MAVPTFTSVTPSVMRAQGRSLITIEGTNFREPDPAPATGQTVEDGFYPVEVLINGEPAMEVLVYDPTFLTCRAPDWRGNVNLASDPLPATVDITIRNIDNNGDPIAGEEVTAAAAFTYTRQRVTAESPTWLNRVLREIVSSFRRYVHFNTQLNVHTESYDLTSGDLRLLKLGDLPGLVLEGPLLVPAPMYTNNHRIEVSSGALTVDELRRHSVFHLEFDIEAFSDRSDELANLVQLCTEYVHGHGHILVDPDPATGETDRREYEIMWIPGQEPKMRSTPNNSNLRVAEGRFVVLGVDLETRDILARHYLRDDSDPTIDPVENTSP